MKLLSWIKQLSADDKLAAAFAEFIYRHAERNAETAAMSAALVSSKLSNGHICIDLREDADTIFTAQNMPPFDEIMPPAMKQRASWEKALLESKTVFNAEAGAPMVLENGRLYLERYWNYERITAEELRERAHLVSDWDEESLLPYLNILFEDDEAALQKEAAQSALSNRLSIISGGPGTGKTTTAAGIIFLMLLREPKLRVALAAPTGKAAARMMEAVASARVNIEERLNNKMKKPDPRALEALTQMSAITETTMHRLLRLVPGVVHSIYDADNPLPYDLVIIDEASMIDSAMMAKFFKALGREASCVILGDKDQLSSVEAGAVFSEICGSAQKSGILKRNVTILEKSWRFAERPGIGALSAAVNNSFGASKLKKIFEENAPESGIELISFGNIESLVPFFIQGYKKFIESEDIVQALALMSSFTVLSPVKKTPYGVRSLNSKIEDVLEHAGLITRDTAMYINRPIMITKNDYQLRLFNGDIGIVREDSSGNRKIYFTENEGMPRSVLPSLLPAHETVFAMTVHKSQGSEFDEVMLVLPDHDMPILTKEILYTGITRAKKKLMLFCKEEILAKAASRKISSASGLADRLKAG